MTLLPCPDNNELLRIKAEREARKAGRSVQPVDCGHEEPILTELEAKVFAPPDSKVAVRAVNLTTQVFRGALIRLSGTVHGAPRTKKGHTTLGIKQSPAYRAFRDGIIAGMLGQASFPPIPLHLEAHFYVDSRGKTADLVNLLQGFQDALENAAVIPNDIWIESVDRSRKHVDTLHPRVEFTIEAI